MFDHMTSGHVDEFGKLLILTWVITQWCIFIFSGVYGVGISGGEDIGNFPSKMR